MTRPLYTDPVRAQQDREYAEALAADQAKDRLAGTTGAAAPRPPRAPDPAPEAVEDSTPAEAEAEKREQRDAMAAAAMRRMQLAQVRARILAHCTCCCATGFVPESLLTLRTAVGVGLRRRLKRVLMRCIWVPPRGRQTEEGRRASPKIGALVRRKLSTCLLPTLLQTQTQRTKHLTVQK